MISSTPTEMKVGFIMGRTTRKKVRSGPQPSITAASSISSGIVLTNPENMNTASPAPKPRYTIGIVHGVFNPILAKAIEVKLK